MNYLLGNWHSLVPAPWNYVALTLTAVFCGTIVGTEREKREKPAGLRTQVLVCLGAAIFTMVSFAFGTTTGDTGRVAAQIVTGIGFIGAGVIMHGRTVVSGLTTAATVWTMAAVGIVAGVGFVVPAIGLSIVVRLVLTGLWWCERQFLGEVRVTTIEMSVDPNHGKTRLHLERLMEEHQVPSRMEVVGPDTNGVVHLRLRFELPRRLTAEFLDEVADLSEVLEIRKTEELD